MNEPKIPRQINKWLCHKLECFADYIDAYTRKNSRCCYMDLFAGCGSCTCKGTDCLVDGSELRALKTKNRFAKFIFVVKNPRDAESLKRLTNPLNADNSVAIVAGNCISDRVMRQALDLIPRSTASIALVDPPGYRGFRWSMIRKLAAHGSDWQGHKMDLLIIFPLEMALLRNLSRPECEASINRFYGNQKWQQVRQKRQDGRILLDEARKQLVKLFKTGLKGLGYRYVEDLKPALFSKPPYYHLIWASDSNSQVKKLTDIWGKARYLPCELFHSEKRANVNE
jgi:three-Cys-motif partner protein